MNRSAQSATYSPAIPPGPNRVEWPQPVKFAAAAGLLAALFVALLWHPWLVLGAMLAFAVLVPALVLAWRYPEFGVLVMVFLGSRVIDPRRFELRLPTGGGLELPDMALLFVLGLAILRQLVNRKLYLPPSWVLGPLLVFLWWSIFSAARAVLALGVEPSWALNELRGIGYYSVIMVVLWQIQTRQQLARFLVGLFAIGLFVVAIMLITQFVGPVPLFSGQETSSWQIIGQEGGGVTRIRPPAHVLLYFLSILAFVLAAFARQQWVRAVSFGLALFLNVALLLTFTRSQWIASVLALGLCFVFFPSRARVAMIALAAGLLIASAALFVTQRERFETFFSYQNFATPLVSRIESIFYLEETLDSYSARTRFFQTDAALDAIRRNPGLGVGLGNEYRGLTPEEARSRYTRFIRFIENSYLYMTTKMGIPGMLLFGALAAAALIGAARHYRAAHDPLLKGVALACLTSLIGVLVWAFNHPLLMLPEYTIMVGLIIGMSEAVGLINRGDVSNESPV